MEYNKELCETVLFQYFFSFRENLKKLESNFFNNSSMNKTINMQIATFFQKQFSKFIDAYSRVFHKNYPGKLHYQKDKGCHEGYFSMLGEFRLKLKLEKEQDKKKNKRRILKKLKLNYLEFRSKQEEEVQVDLLKTFSTISDSQISELVEQIIYLHPEIFINTFKSIDSYNQMQGEKYAFVMHIMPPQWHPLIKALRKKDKKVACLIYDDVLAHGEYGMLATKEIESDIIYFLNFISVMIFILECQNQPILFSGETYHWVRWDGIIATFMYLNLATMLETVKKLRAPSDNNLNLMLYDALKPVTSSLENIGNNLSISYKLLMQQPDKIVYTSNSERFGEYVENTYGIKTPRIHFYRHSEKLNEHAKPRLPFGKNNDEFHVVSITGFCNRGVCKTREFTYLAVKWMLEQKIHFHYYTNDTISDINWFLALVDANHRRYFHTHTVNRDQQELVNELHQYHAGFNGSDFLAFAEGMCALKDDMDYRTGMLNFMLSTFGTSFHVYAAAGVPLIVPGMYVDSCTYFDNFCLKMNLTDFKNAKSYFLTSNLKSKCENYQMYNKNSSIDMHIDRFIENISTNHSHIFNDTLLAKELLI